jgi:hypothetical protein
MSLDSARAEEIVRETKTLDPHPELSSHDGPNTNAASQAVL